MKKVGLGSLLLGLFSINLISAETVASEFARGSAEAIAAFFESLALSPDNTTKILLGMLLYIIIYSVIKQMFKAKTGGANWFAGIISLLMVLLTFLGLPAGYVETIVLQYGAMGATILTVIPFLVLLYFSLAVADSIFVARAVWVWYILYYFSLLIYKISTLSTATSKAEYIPYVFAVIAGLIVFGALRWVRQLVFKGQLENFEEKGVAAASRRELLQKLEKKNLEAFGTS